MCVQIISVSVNFNITDDYVLLIIIPLIPLLHSPQNTSPLFSGWKLPTSQKAPRILLWSAVNAVHHSQPVTHVSSSVLRPSSKWGPHFHGHIEELRPRNCSSEDRYQLLLSTLRGRSLVTAPSFSHFYFWTHTRTVNTARVVHIGLLLIEYAFSRQTGAVFCKSSEFSISYRCSFCLPEVWEVKTG